ncbi:hypothetical protein SLEP1_g37748 [Rubroshorea leprosula]|uniref:Reverse transcriptase Ty1/copia-type domain-containing protein n=1 Tax=Rubroshorea leprosula TaxID=152421 RepID=A0AAV5KWA7_9ROSI|nr:hypothetical protein SLEP1_g37748 [Rubroshorea leprosula]
MSEEFSALVHQGMWDLVPAHPSQHLIGSKWVFRLKHNQYGNIERYKARLVAKGFHQRPSSDYFNTFSPVIKPTIIQMILSIVVSCGWLIQQLDVNNAFLHGKLDEKLFLQQPVVFVDLDKPTHVCRLWKSIYGLKQAPRAWYKELKAFLLFEGFHNSKSDKSLFILHKDSTVIYFLVYVDDIILTEAINTTVGLFLSQQRYISDLLHKTGMADAKPVTTPMASSASSLHSIGTALSDGTDYQRVVGSLQYLALTGPDISFVVSRLSQFMHCPTDTHWQAAKHVLRYLKGTSCHELLLRPQSSLLLHAFSNADWAGDRATCVSTTGYIVFLSATYLSVNPVLHSRMKHIAIDLHFIRDLVDKKLFHVSHISSHD